MEDTNYQPWHPMTDTQDLKTLGKLGEECGELSAVVSRCIIQGILETNPDSGISNHQWLEEEIADVLANIQLVIEHFKLNQAFIDSRRIRKKLQLIQWHRMA